jgi:hypothetical protein
MSKALSIVAALVLLGAGLVFFLKPELLGLGPVSEPTDPGPRAVPEQVESGKPGEEEAPAAVEGKEIRKDGSVLGVRPQTGEAPKGALSLPDGSWVMPLNGVTDPAPYAWPKDREYSPIVGRRWIKGKPPLEWVEWYVHADGSMSTTYMAWRADLGRKDAQTSIALPSVAQQLLNDDGGR